MKRLALLLSLAWPLGLAAEVTKEDVLKLLASHSSDETLMVYIRRNAPARPLSTQDILDLRHAGASDAVITTLVESSRASPEPGERPPEGLVHSGPDTVLETPEYYPYYYDYYPNYYPYLYTYPGFSFYFYWPYYYHRHHYTVPPFPYYGHEGWRYHHSYPYHSGNWAYHPWFDHHGFDGYRPHSPGPRGHATPGGPHWGVHGGHRQG